MTHHDHSHHHGCGPRRFARPDASEYGGMRRRRFGGRHGSAGRMFDQGDLRFVMLHLIAEKPRHGYELIKAIEDSLGGGYSPSPGVVYPTLTWLEEIGYATVAPTEGGRKLYAITEEGTRYLEANRVQLDAILARMAEIGAARSSSQSPEILRAWENLKLALRLRTARGPLGATELDAVATALDAAARAIEKS